MTMVIKIIDYLVWTILAIWFLGTYYLFHKDLGDWAADGDKRKKRKAHIARLVILAVMIITPILAVSPLTSEAERVNAYNSGHLRGYEDVFCECEPDDDLYSCYQELTDYKDDRYFKDYVQGYIDGYYDQAAKAGCFNNLD